MVVGGARVKGSPPRQYESNPYPEMQPQPQMARAHSQLYDDGAHALGRFPSNN